MSDESRRRPWWKRKRWLAALLLFPLVVYPLSVGPLCYAATRGWLAGGPYYARYRPVVWLAESGPEPIATWALNYLMWWQELAARHTGDAP